MPHIFIHLLVLPCGATTIKLTTIIMHPFRSLPPVEVLCYTVICLRCQREMITTEHRLTQVYIPFRLSIWDVPTETTIMLVPDTLWMTRHSFTLKFSLRIMFIFIKEPLQVRQQSQKPQLLPVVQFRHSRVLRGVIAQTIDCTPC